MRVERAECERETDIVDGIFQPAIGAPLDDNFANFLAGIDLGRIERRSLTRLSGQHEIACFDAPACLEEIERPRFLGNGHEASEGRHFFRITFNLLSYVAGERRYRAIADAMEKPPANVIGCASEDDA